MTAFSGAFTQMLVLACITLIGYVAARLGYLDVPTRDKLTQLMLNVTLPAMILASAANLDASTIKVQLPWALGLGALQFFGLLVSGWVFNLCFRVRAQDRPTYLFMSVLTNASFIGIPVIAALHGSHTVLLTSVFMMGMDVFFFSIGLGLLSAEQSPWKLLRSSLFNMPMLACGLAVGSLFTGWRLPGFLQTTAEMIGAVTAPVAMMLIGVVMTSITRRDVLGEWRLYPFILLHQVVWPLAWYCILRPFVHDGIIVSIYVLMFAMPIGSMAAALVGASGRDPRLAGTGTLLSTAASFPLIPLLVWLIGMI